MHKYPMHTAPAPNHKTSETAQAMFDQALADFNRFIHKPAPTVRKRVKRKEN